MTAKPSHPVRSFPNGFVWGASTAGHQVEGGSTNSDTWFLEQIDGSVFRQPSGAACNSWELWKEDIDLVAAMGLGAYRFSVEWARIEPERGVFSNDALARYNAMVDYCVERGIAPVVTFNHFTLPHWVACMGAWLHADVPQLFARYCEAVMVAIGDRIKFAVTLNEPNLGQLLTWVLPPFVRDLERATLVAATAAAGVDKYRVGNVSLVEEFGAMQDGLTAGHRAAKAAIKAIRPDLPVGVSLAIVDDQVVGADSSLRDQKRAEVYGHWLGVASEDDFVGVQNYERAYYDANGPVIQNPDAPKNDMGTIIEPGSLAGTVRYAYEFAGVAVLVTEHGMSTHDDKHRAAFIEPSLAALLDVIDDGVPVIGYLHWSLLDNFEWIFGYDQQLGLHAVDRVTFVRTPKPSAAVLARIAQVNAVGA
jgi:beta-glucosidase